MMKEWPAPIPSAFRVAEIDKVLVVARTPDETGTGSLGEGDSETQLRAGSHQGLMQVLNCLDKVSLTNDDVHPFGFLDGIGAQLHDPLLTCSATTWLRVEHCRLHR